MTKTAQVPYPDLTLGEDATPRSQVFDDVYFSRDGGVLETQHVFLEGNQLLQKWREGKAEPRSGGGKERGGIGRDTPFNQNKNFTIAELGFGTGLNFLVTWHRYLRARAEERPGKLHYIAIEKFPLTPSMLAQTLALQPDLAALSAQLLAQYPARLPGWHRLHFGAVTLTLGFGDVAELLPHVPAQIDAWYLDGFTPAKNEAMWTEEVLSLVAAKSAPGASFATFTVAAAVREGLAARGFEVRKLRGFGKKRDMLAGELIISEGGLPPYAPLALTLPLRDSALPRTDYGSTENILILGGGIAGCSAARALAERGIKVQLLTRGIADGASGNAVGVLFPQLSKQWLPSTHWFFSGADFTRRRAQQWQQETHATLISTPGMLRLPRHAEEAHALQQIHEKLGLDESIVQWVDAAQASAIAGVELQSGAAWLKQGSWVAPVALCQQLLQHEHITLRSKTQVTALARDANRWCVQLENGEMLQSEHILVANAQEAAALLPVSLPLGITSGQVSLLSAAHAASMPRVILCHKGYVVPQGDTLLVGATYDRVDLSGAVTPENHAKNMAELEHFLPGFVQAMPYAGRTSLRATTPDRLPYVGQVAPGLWVSIGHGSRGFCSAPLAGEIIASELCGEMLPVEPALRRAVGVERVLK